LKSIQYICLYARCGLFFSFCLVFASPGGYAATRTQIITKALDCWAYTSDENVASDGMAWQEICITNPSAFNDHEGSHQDPRSISIQMDKEGEVKFYRDPAKKSKVSDGATIPEQEKYKRKDEEEFLDEEDIINKIDAALGVASDEPLIQDRDVLEDRDLVDKYKRQTSDTKHPEEEIPIQDRDVLEDRNLIDKYNKILEPSPDEADDVLLIDKDVLEDRDLVDQYDELQLNKATAPDVLHLERDDPLGSFEFGTEAYAYQYREPNVMKDTGYLYGLYATINFRSHWNKKGRTLKEIFDDHRFFNFIRLDTRGAFGQVDYESTRTGTMTDLPYYTFEGRGLFGYDLPLWDSVLATPYLGLGWRYLYDDGGAERSSTGHYSYDRESRYFYLPVGLEVMYEWKKDWQFTVAIEYDYLVEGKQKSHLDDLGQSVRSSESGDLYVLDPLINKQKEGFGLRGSFKLVKKSAKFDIEVEPFVRYWNLEDSDTKQLSSDGGGVIWYYDDAHEYPVLGYEPKNNTTEFGLKVGINY